jgi:Zn-finger nucleic acid-binding protein
MNKYFITCPKCSNLMEKVEYAPIVVDRCSNCCGIWFDRVEADSLKTAQAAKVLDVGDTNTGKMWDSDTEINCPICEYPMESRTDNRQNHIRYENCPKCYGVFFDAGELKSYQKHSLGDFFKLLFL